MEVSPRGKILKGKQDDWVREPLLLSDRWEDLQGAFCARQYGVWSF